MMTEKISILQDHFLIAMPVFTDFNFNRAVIYVCAHSEDGAMGIVINHPLIDIDLGEILQQMNIILGNEKIKHLPVLLGGPVQPERGFILHHANKTWDSTLVTSNELAITSSQDILKAMAKNEGPDDFLMILGYAGWGAGQLEQEVASNCWLVAPADLDIIFKTPFEERWEEAAKLIGVNVDYLSSDVGHA